MGDNGAGKSTLVKIIAGNFRPSHGRSGWTAREVRLRRPVEDARDHGIEIVYQDLALCDNLTAADNVFLGREIRRRIGPFARARLQGDVRRAGGAVRRAAIRDPAARPRAQMSGGQRQAVAIARTRLAEAEIVLMDEPTAAISVRQVAEVLDLIRRLRDRASRSC